MVKIKPLKFEFAAYVSFPWKLNRYSYGVQFGINCTALDLSKLSNFVECTIIIIIIIVIIIIVIIILIIIIVIITSFKSQGYLVKHKCSLLIIGETAN